MLRFIFLTIFSIVTTFGLGQANNISPQIFSAISSKRIRPNSNYNVTVFVEPSATSGLTFTFHLKSYELYDYKILNPDDDYYGATNIPSLVPLNATILASSTSVSIRPGQSDQVTLTVGHLDQPRYNLTMTAIDESTGKIFEDFNLVVQETNQKKQSLMVQTDKMIYKPGETVKFRIILLDHHLHPMNNQSLNVTLSDPEQNVIKLWKREVISGGIFRSHLKLSQEPLQGDWTITVDCNDETKSHSFKVEEYVLPKFKVEIVPPSFITWDTSKFVVEVKGSYTFGKKISGNAEVQIANFVTYYRNPQRTKTITKKQVLDGSAFFEIDIQTEFETDRRSSREKAYYISATVTEGLTGKQMNATAVKLTSYQWAHKIEKYQTTDKFKPGMPFTFTFKITQQDGRPVTDGNRTVEFRHGLGCLAEDELKSTTLPHSGIVSFTIDQMPTNERMQLAPVLVTYEGQTVEFPSPARYVSPSRTYLQLNLPSTANANTAVDLDVIVTKPVTTLTVVVFGRGQVHSVKTLTSDSTTAHKVSLQIPAAAAPKATIIVYTIFGDEFIAESAEITVTNYFQNFLNLTISKSVAAPSETVSVTMATTTGSLILLRAVDQSVLLLTTDKDITSSVVEDEFKGYLPEPDAFRQTGGSSTFQIFEEAGITVFTNSKLDRVKPRQQSFDVERRVRLHKVSKTTTSLEIMEISDDLEYFEEFDNDSVQPTVRLRPKKKNELKVRKDFPETWIWDEIQTNQSVTSVDKVVPDTLTSWILSGYALNQETGIGVVHNPLTLRTFRPFFLTLNKPYSIVKGEIFGLQVLVHNYFEANVTASVTLKNLQGAFDFYEEPKKDVTEVIKEVTLLANEVKAVIFVIRPNTFGPMKLDVMVTCSLAGDAVSQILLVKPPGQRQERNQAILLDLRLAQIATGTLRTDFPPNRVAGADNVRISVISDLLGSTVKNLDKLLKMPYGCGEQNMVTFVPDIVILEYLKAVEKLSPEIKAKATQFLESGYQRELTYRHDDGSFSAFGKSDAHGSTWLTAFVVRSFVAAKPHITVDETVIQKSLRFLAATQRKEGNFLERGRLLNSAMKGGATDDFSLTAYVLLAFLESNSRSEFSSIIDFDKVVTKGLGYLTQANPETLQVYPLTLVTFALQAANSSLTPKFQTALQKLAINEGSLTYWQPPKDNVTRASWEAQTTPLAVEMTAYNLLIALKDNSLEQAVKSGKWLLGQRNAEGGFISTQDTVVGLTALAKFALATYSPNVDLTIKADGNVFQVNSDNAMALQEITLPSSTQEVTFEATGSGTALAQLSWTYYVETESESPQFTVEVKLMESEIKGNLALKICTTYMSPDGNKAESNMVVMEVNLPSGYAFEREELTEVELTIGVKRIDLEESATRLNIYFDYLNSAKKCVDVTAAKVFDVADAAPAYVSVYDYYDTTQNARAFYTPVAVSPLVITCDQKSCV